MTIYPNTNPDSPLFTQPRARATDPKTSHGAARMAKATAKKTKAQVLSLLKRNPGGLTDPEIARLLNSKTSGPRGRRADLVREGLVEAAYTYKRDGRTHTVWKAVRE